MCGHEGGALRRWMMKDPANIIIKAKLQQEAEKTPCVDFLSELPILMRERYKNKTKDFEFLSSWLFLRAEEVRLNPSSVGQ